jgi:hypothetical protein
MDKLPEPEFNNDKNWPRLLTGVEEYIANKEKNRNALFALFTGASIYRYWREVTFYKNNHGTFMFLVVPTFVFTSYQLARFLTYDPNGYSALRNNQSERSYLDEYRALWKEARKKNIDFPDHLIR